MSHLGLSRELTSLDEDLANGDIFAYGHKSWFQHLAGSQDGHATELGTISHKRISERRCDLNQTCSSAPLPSLPCQ